MGIHKPDVLCTRKNHQKSHGLSPHSRGDAPEDSSDSEGFGHLRFMHHLTLTYSSSLCWVRDDISDDVIVVMCIV